MARLYKPLICLAHFLAMAEGSFLDSNGATLTMRLSGNIFDRNVWKTVEQSPFVDSGNSIYSMPVSDQNQGYGYGNDSGKGHLGKGGPKLKKGSMNNPAYSIGMSSKGKGGVGGKGVERGKGKDKDKGSIGKGKGAVSKGGDEKGVMSKKGEEKGGMSKKGKGKGGMSKEGTKTNAPTPYYTAPFGKGTKTNAPTPSYYRSPSGMYTFSPTQNTSQSLSPTAYPSKSSLYPPSYVPTRTRVPAQSAVPTSEPSRNVTSTPNTVISAQPSTAPSISPSNGPSFAPSSGTNEPTFASTTDQPAVSPNLAPSSFPTQQPSTFTIQPNIQPTTTPSKPTNMPSFTASALPTGSPSSQPVAASITPTTQPSTIPTPSATTFAPTMFMTATSLPTSLNISVTSIPSSTGSTSAPSFVPTVATSSIPSSTGSSRPSAQPSIQQPSPLEPQSSSFPSIVPTALPSTSKIPSSTPSLVPSSPATSTKPTTLTSENPSSVPTLVGSPSPSSMQAVVGSTMPSNVPSSVPVNTNSSPPSSVPVIGGSSVPSSVPISTSSSTPSSPVTVTPTASAPPSSSAKPTSRPSSSFIPSAPPTISNSSSSLGLNVSATPFILEYTVSGANATLTDFEPADNFTIEFLQGYLSSQFGLNPSTNVQSCDVMNNGHLNSPPQSAFNLVAIFANTSEFVPAPNDIDILIQSAFQQPAVQTLLNTLGQLPSDNPFSTTSSITYSQGALSPQSRFSQDDPTNGGGISLAVVGVIACIIVVLLAGIGAVFVMRSKNRYKAIRHQMPNEKQEMPYNSSLMAFRDYDDDEEESLTSKTSMSYFTLSQQDYFGLDR